MSDTPRTDGFLNETSEQFHDTAWIEHSQQLERELNDEKQHITELENRLRALWDKLEGERKYYQDRIKRLEEAGDELLDWIGSDVSDANRKLIIDSWRNAKEAKP